MTTQEGRWEGEFGDEYNKRNDMTPMETEVLYHSLYGISRRELNRIVLNAEEIPMRILEVGCGTGDQLAYFNVKCMGYDLQGIDVNEKAVKRAQERGFNVQQGSAMSLPFEDNSFDLVYTSGLLIHIRPKDIKTVMGEIVRVSRKYVWGFEYYSELLQEIPYRDNPNSCWKDDYARLYRDNHKMKLLRQIMLKRLTDGHLDTMFLLSKGE